MKQIYNKVRCLSLMQSTGSTLIVEFLQKQYEAKASNDIIHTQLIPKLFDSLKRYIGQSASTPDITPY